MPASSPATKAGGSCFRGRTEPLVAAGLPRWVALAPAGGADYEGPKWQSDHAWERRRGQRLSPNSLDMGNLLPP